MRIIIATGDTDLRLGIELALSEEPGVKIVGVASEMHGLLALVKTAAPDKVVVDWRLVGLADGEKLREIKMKNPHPQIIALGPRNRTMDEAFQAGADLYLFIGDPPEKLLTSIRKTNQ